MLRYFKTIVVKFAYTLSFLLFAPIFIYAQGNTPSLNDTISAKKVNYAFIPIVSYNNSFGMQFGFMTNGYFNLNKKDTVSPASMVAIMANMFTNKTLFTGVFNKMYFDEDHWRTKMAIGYGDINFQTFIDVPYGIPENTNKQDTGIFINYRTQMAFSYGEGMKMIANRMYLGLRLTYTHINTNFEDNKIPNERLTLFGIGISGEYDIRDNVFTPHKGMNIKLQTFSFFEALGSTDTYNRMQIQLNKYFDLNTTTTILVRGYSATSFGKSIPFNGKNVVGRDDLRGYSQGKYRANQVYNIQTEYRWTFYKRLGMVAFGGIAIATDDIKGTNYSGLLPAIGTGLRFNAIPKRNINIGVDIAKGIDDWGLYFRIGEAFTR